MIKNQRIAINSYSNLSHEDWKKFKIKLIKKDITITKWFEDKIKEEIKYES